jgi:hypothetical protein
MLQKHDNIIAMKVAKGISGYYALDFAAILYIAEHVSDLCVCVHSQYFRSGIVLKGGSWSREEEEGRGGHHPDSAAMGFSCCLLRILGGPLTTIRQARSRYWLLKIPG